MPTDFEQPEGAAEWWSFDSGKVSSYGGSTTLYRQGGSLLVFCTHSDFAPTSDVQIPAGYNRVDAPRIGDGSVVYQRLNFLRARFVRGNSMVSITFRDAASYVTTANVVKLASIIAGRIPATVPLKQPPPLPQNADENGFARRFRRFEIGHSDPFVASTIFTGDDFVARLGRDARSATAVLTLGHRRQAEHALCAVWHPWHTDFLPGAAHCPWRLYRPPRNGRCDLCTQGLYSQITDELHGGERHERDTPATLRAMRRAGAGRNEVLRDVWRGAATSFRVLRQSTEAHDEVLRQLRPTRVVAAATACSATAGAPGRENLRVLWRSAQAGNQVLRELRHTGGSATCAATARGRASLFALRQSAQSRRKILRQLRPAGAASANPIHRAQPGGCRNLLALRRSAQAGRQVL